MKTDAAAGVNCDAAALSKWLSVVSHIRNPQNLITYLLFTAWCKFMGISSYIPTVTIG